MTRHERLRLLLTLLKRVQSEAAALRAELTLLESDECHGRIPTIEEAERILIRRAMIQANGHHRRAASMLGIGERTLYRKLAEMRRGQSSTSGGGRTGAG